MKVTAKLGSESSQAGWVDISTSDNGKTCLHIFSRDYGEDKDLLMIVDTKLLAHVMRAAALLLGEP